MLLDSISECFIEDFCISVCKGYWSTVYRVSGFVVVVGFFCFFFFESLALKVMQGSWNQLGSFSLSDIFWKHLRIGVNSFFSVW